MTYIYERFIFLPFQSEGRLVHLFLSYGQTPCPFLIDFGSCIHHYRRSEARSQLSVERLAFRLWSSASVCLRITTDRLELFSWLFVRMLRILLAEWCIYEFIHSSHLNRKINNLNCACTMFLSNFNNFDRLTDRWV